MLVNPDNGGRFGIFNHILFEQRQLAWLRGLLFDPLQQDAVLAFRIDIQLVPVRSQDSSGQQHGEHRNRDLHESHLQVNSESLRGNFSVLP